MQYKCFSQLQEATAESFQVIYHSSQNQHEFEHNKTLEQTHINIH